MTSEQPNTLLNGIPLLPNATGNYLIFNRHTGRIYVGQAKSVRKRCSAHFSRLRQGDHPNYKMQHDATMYGAGHFWFAPLLADLSEHLAIQALGGLDLDLGYNLMDGREWTAEARLRVSEARLIKNRRYVYLPSVTRSSPVQRVLLQSWVAGLSNRSE